MKRMMVRGCQVVLVAVCFTLISGCGGSGGRDIDAQPVSGTVTYNGAPVGGAAVTFVPASPDGTSAVGMTDASGKYTLKSYSGTAGAVAGEYKVKIMKMSGGDAPAAGDGGVGQGDQEYGADYNPTAAEDKEPENLLPAKYADEATSGLTATVAAGENEGVDFALAD